MKYKITVFLLQCAQSFREPISQPNKYYNKFSYFKCIFVS